MAFWYEWRSVVAGLGRRMPTTVRNEPIDKESTMPGNKRLVYRLGLATLILLIALSAVFGCGGPRKTIIGKWEEIEGQIRFEFYKDGTVTQVGYIGYTPVTLTGSYKFIDDTHIRLDFEGILGGSSVHEIHISGDRLTLDHREFTRVK